MLRKFGLSAAAILACAVCSAQQRYAQHSVTINAGILLLDALQTSSGALADDTPHALYNFDSNTRVKPAAWNIDNPQHPSLVDAAINTRWGALVGLQVHKQDAAYWEVSLSQLTEAQLAQYDFLLLPAHGNVSLNTAEREKLRRFVDKGGILWIDINANIGGNNTVPGLDIINNTPLPFALGSANSFLLNPYWDHPLLSHPFRISQQELALLPHASSPSVRQVTSGDIGAMSTIEIGVTGDSTKLQRITGDVPANGMDIAVGKIGDGYEVVTTQGVATTLNNVPGVAGNNAYTGAPPIFNATSNAAAKFVVNAINLAGSYNEEGRGPRNANSSPVSIDAPMLSDFVAPGAFTPGSKGYRSAAVYKGMLVVSNGTQLYVYNAVPGTDLAHTGSPDQGIPDYLASGTSYDLIWQSSSLGTISGPTCIEVPAAPAGQQDQVWVVDGRGHMLEFDVFQHFSGPNINAVTPDKDIAPPTTAGGDASFTANDGPGPYAPTASDGLLFVSDMTSGTGSEGRVWIADPVAKTMLKPVGAADGWFAGGQSNGIIPEPTGPVTVGYIPIQDNSGGSDRVVYIPTRASSLGSSNTGGVTSLWVGARGERPQSFTVNANQLVVVTRATQNGNEVYFPDPSETDPTALALGPKLTVLDQNGNPLNAPTMANYFTGQVTQFAGVLNFQMSNPSGLAADYPNYTVRVDYTLNWAGQPSDTAKYLRGQLFLPDDDNHSRRILNEIALSPQGTMHLVFSTQDPSTADNAGGSYYAISEEGRGQFIVKARYDLYNSFYALLDSSTEVLYKATFRNRDPVTSIFPFLSAPLTNLTYISSPVISNGVVYVTAEGFIGSVPNTIVMAFKAEPDTVEIKTGDLGPNPEIFQPNILQTLPDKTHPDQSKQITIAPNQYKYEQQPGADYGIIRFENLSQTSSGELNNVFNLSEPVIIRKSGSPDSLLEPDRNGSRWSPLLWYTVFTGVGNTNAGHVGQTGPVLVAGNTLFMPATSVLPSFLSGPPYVPQGMLFGMTTDISTNDPFMSADPDRPWLNQLFQMGAPLGTTISINNILPNPDFVWPQASGVTSFNDYRTRVLQSTLSGSSIAYGLIGAADKLYAWSDNGLFGFSRADFTITDENRAAEMDAVGNPIWSTDQSLTTGPADVGGAGTVHPLVHPVRAYPLGQDQTLVVDPGSDRLALLDRDGRETRSIDKFALDPNGFRPEGYRANEPTTFSRPEDVAAYTTIVTTGNPLANPQAAEYWEHYLVADTGNNRLVDIVDRYAYNPATEQIGNPIALGVLYWHSPEIVAGKKYSYTSVSRIFLGGASGAWKIAAGVTNVEPTAAGGGLAQQSSGATQEAATGNGGIIVFDNANTQIINSVAVPSIGGNILFTPDSTSELNGIFSQPAVNGRNKLIHSLNSVSTANVNGQLAIMFTDDSGVYEVQDSGGGNWAVTWMLPRTVPVSLGVSAPVYSVMRRTTSSDVPTTDNPLDFRPTYAKRLPSGDVLIVNGYVGRFRKAPTDPAQQFRGEIIGVDGTTTSSPNPTGFGYDPTQQNLGFSSKSIKFEIPPVTGTRGLVAPTFADRR